MKVIVCGILVRHQLAEDDLGKNNNAMKIAWTKAAEQGPVSRYRWIFARKMVRKMDLSKDGSFESSIISLERFPKLLLTWTRIRCTQDDLRIVPVHWHGAETGYDAGGDAGMSEENGVKKG